MSDTTLLFEECNRLVEVERALVIGIDTLYNPESEQTEYDCQIAVVGETVLEESKLRECLKDAIGYLKYLGHSYNKKDGVLSMQNSRGDKIDVLSHAVIIDLDKKQMHSLGLSGEKFLCGLILSELYKKLGIVKDVELKELLLTKPPLSQLEKLHMILKECTQGCSIIHIDNAEVLNSLINSTPFIKVANIEPELVYLYQYYTIDKYGYLRPLPRRNDVNWDRIIDGSYLADLVFKVKNDKTCGLWKLSPMSGGIIKDVFSDLDSKSHFEE